MPHREFEVVPTPWDSFIFNTWGLGMSLNIRALVSTPCPSLQLSVYLLVNALTGHQP